MDNINWILEKQLCSGCGVCAVGCPMECIKIVEGENVNYPYIDQTKCIKCKKCLSLCPGNSFINRLKNKEKPKIIDDNTSSCFVSYACDQAIRYNSASGGFITGFLIYLLKSKYIDGVICVKQSKENPLINRAFVAVNEEQILEASGSRYLPTSNCLAIKDMINEDKKYAFVGKPCDIEALTNLQKRDHHLRNSIVLKIGLICACTPTRQGTKEILKAHKISLNDIKSLKFRGKGWPGYFQVEYGSGEKLKIPYLAAWNNYISKYYGLRCFLCDDPLASYADITVGDPWGDEFKLESKGLSALIIRNSYVEKLYQDSLSCGIIASKPISMEDIKRYQIKLLGKQTNALTFYLAYKHVFKLDSNLREICNEYGSEFKSYLRLIKKIYIINKFKNRWRYT